MRFWFSAAAFCIPLLLISCGSSGYGTYGNPNMGGPPAEVREAQIATEPTGNFYYGRRYYVKRTRFWGYLREPRQPWSRAKLVVFNERQKRAPDRLPEGGASGRTFSYDSNYEYRIKGRYTGVTVYDPNSNQFLPEFLLTGYELLSRDPGWLFSPADHYDPHRFTLLPN